MSRKQKLLCQENRSYYVKKTEVIMSRKQKLLCQENRSYYVKKTDNNYYVRIIPKILCQETVNIMSGKHKFFRFVPFRLPYIYTGLRIEDNSKPKDNVHAQTYIRFFQLGKPLRLKTVDCIFQTDERIDE